MKHLRNMLLLAAVLTASASLGQTPRYLGGDVSLLPSYEQQGTVYKDSAGQPVRLLPYLRQQGWNAIRVRLFVDPQHAPQANKDEGVCQDLNYVLAFCRQIKEAGLALMLDLHYSDTWADPAKQFMPHRWLQTAGKDLPDSVYRYTVNTLQTFRDAGLTPDMIQVGNEITNGMLWPVGRLYPEKGEERSFNRRQAWDTLCQLLKAGCRACREVCPSSRIIIHTEKAGDWPVTRTYYRQLRRHHVDYDIIGLSYYPMWHGTIPNLGQNLQRLARHFSDKPVMIVETAAYYSHENDPWAAADTYAEFYPISPEGQQQFTRELVTELRRHDNVTGLFWWFPEENAYGNSVVKGWLNRGLFDNHSGQVMPAMREFGKFGATK